MKLPDFSNDPKLKDLCRRMGVVTFSNWESDASWSRISTAEWKELADRGIDVSINDISTADDGTLEYKGEKVIVYIRDQQANQDGSPREYKYHISNCSTLDMMRQAGRSDRYVVSTRQDGSFKVNLFMYGDIIAKDRLLPMKVCKNCLTRLNFNNYDSNPAVRMQVYRDFSLEEFLSICSPSFVRMPKYTDENQPLNVYPLDWSRLAARIKEERGYKCEGCGHENTSRGKLHLHHIDFNKFNNVGNNLKVLCVACHTKLHPHISRGGIKKKHPPIEKISKCPKCGQKLRYTSPGLRYRCPSCEAVFTL